MVFISERKEEPTVVDENGSFIPISKLLGEMDLSHIERVLLEYLNYAQRRKWEYPPIVLFKLLMVKTFRQLSYRRLVSTLTRDDCEFLGINEIEPGIFSIPSASTIHDFAYNRLGPDGLKAIIYSNGVQICHSIRNGTGMIDSSPVEASRYDKYARFNSHYGCKMYKMHIFHLNDIPLFHLFSEGNDHDTPYAIPLAEKVQYMLPCLKKIQLNAGYDSFLIHAAYWKMFKVQPLIEQRDNKKIQFEGTEERIDHWVNKLWKKRGNIKDSIDKKLEFLYDNNRGKQVRMYIRNLNLLNPIFQEQL